jgi:rhodanese-related sulfurtransferase
MSTNERRGDKEVSDGNLRSYWLLGSLGHPSSVDTASIWGEDLNERSVWAEFGSRTCERTETSKQSGRVHQPRFKEGKEIAMTIAAINPQAFAELCKNGKKTDLIDVRTPVEYREVHVENARNIPLDQLDPAALMHARNGSASEPLYFICRSGSRGQQACEKFHNAGFTNVVNIEGGTLACVDAALPVVRGKKAISLERQVRLAAGSLILLGAILGWLVHPAFIGLSAFVGAGLLFSGITDTCGMGMLLARMPWNQIPKTSSTAAEAGTTTGASKAPPSCCG